MKIIRLSTENLLENCITDCANPRFSFALDSDKKNVKLKSAKFSVGSWQTETQEQISVPYGGEPLQPFSEYKVTVTATDNYGASDIAETTFMTGRLNEPWQAKWITDGSYKFTKKKISPVPLAFRKKISFKKQIKRALICCTALGVYGLEINGVKVGNKYFTPGFTSYKNSLQYQVYDVTELLKSKSELLVTVAGGWAVGSFIFTRKNRITAKRQALLLELRVEYAGGGTEVIGTDESWEVTREGAVREADFYDGETYDATVDYNKIIWRHATIEKIKIKPQIVAEYGSPVVAHEVFKPFSVKRHGDEIIYDFGQNLAGVVRFTVNGKAGQKITVRHAEVLTGDGGLNTIFLRSAKSRIEYVCKDGIQTYMPQFTYMGFRYAGVSGVDENDIKVESVALYSDIEENGSFECSDALVNRLQQNICWSGKSNFVDIPTDCPQRDERMGWTGDIAVFAQTACYNFAMSRFLEKWLKDLRSEQTSHGGIPNTIPSHGYGFPATMPKKALAFWGDACVFVPWAMYLAYGDKEVLKTNYATMKKYVKACKWWANIGVGKHRYIWSDLPMMQFGDWVAPDVPKMGQWQARCKWTGTASLAAISGLLSKIAAILGEDNDAAYYKKLNSKVNDAYVSILTDGNGKLKNEFQTAYVLPLYFDMFPEGQKEKAVENLAALVERNNYCIGTGFPGTPYILFALADNGRSDVAFKMLLNEQCPSWLYEVKVGATTVWERWDGLDGDGVCRIGDDGTGGMISFNHYGFGSVGDFLYRRIAGIEPLEGGYKTFKIQPFLGGEITYACGEVHTPYGKVISDWHINSGKFELKVSVPACTECKVILPSGEEFTIGSGVYEYTCTVRSD